jgi:choline dehydrogenase-like flavoprotein
MTPDLSFTSQAPVMLNPQSMGSVRLQSNNHLDQPLIDPAYLTHPFDNYNIIAAVRANWRLMKTKTMRQYHKGTINMPKSESDEDILVRMFHWMSH